MTRQEEINEVLNRLPTLQREDVSHALEVLAELRKLGLKKSAPKTVSPFFPTLQTKPASE